VTFLLSVLAARGLSALFGNLLLAASAGPGFSGAALAVERDTVVLQAVLVRGFNRQLDQMLESGSLIALGYTVTLFARGPGGTEGLDTVSFYHAAVYNPVAKRFAVYRSEFAGRPETLVAGLTLRQARDTLARVRLPLRPQGTLPRGATAARIEAALNTIALEAMDNRELDLNVFWNYRYPRALTPWLERK
jgi:hypothetical protein